MDLWNCSMYYCIRYIFRVHNFSRFWTRSGTSRGFNFAIFVLCPLLYIAHRLKWKFSRWRTREIRENKTPAKITAYTVLANVKLFSLVSICLISRLNAHYISDMWWNLFALNTAGISIIKSWTLRSCPSWIHDDRDTVPHISIYVCTMWTCHLNWRFDHVLNFFSALKGLT